MARRRGGFEKKIETVHWARGTPAQFTGLTAGTAAIGAFAAQHLPETLLRLRGNWMAFADGAQAPGGLIQVALGLILVPEGSAATVTWSPITDGDAPWVWIDEVSLAYEEMVTDVIDIPVAAGYRREIDSKAMRKVRNRELQWVVEQVTVGGAMTINVVGNVRGLSGS